jgi:hypothetical protein
MEIIDNEDLYVEKKIINSLNELNNFKFYYFHAVKRISYLIICDSDKPSLSSLYFKYNY